MKLEVQNRQPGHIPLGALLMLPLFALPLGAWLVQQHYGDLGTCAMKLIVGIPCLTCGATRATVRLLHGDLAGALSFQPMILGVYAALLIWGMISLLLFVRGKRARIRLGRRGDILFKTTLVVVPLANWIYLIAAGI